MLDRAEIAAIVPVSDVDKAMEFYGGTLGLELQVRRDDLPENREAEFRAGDGTLVVSSLGSEQFRGAVSQDGRFAILGPGNAAMNDPLVILLIRR